MSAIQVNRKIDTNSCADKTSLKKSAEKHNTLQNWKTVENISVSELADLIGKGFAVRAGIRKTGNKAADVESVSWLFIDIDHSPLEKSLQCPLTQFACLYYFSFSYIPGENEKHRIVFKLSRSLTPTEYENLVTTVIRNFYTDADEIFSPGSLFFGASKPEHVHILNEEATLPVDNILSATGSILSITPPISENASNFTGDGKAALPDNKQTLENDGTIKPRLEALKHLAKHIWIDKCNGEDIDSLYCLDKHNFQKQPKGQNLAKWHGHRPDDDEKETGTGFLVIWNDKELLPTWQNQATGKKGNFIDYWHENSGKDFGSIIWVEDQEYLNFIEICNDICSYFGIPEVDFHKILTKKHEQKLESDDEDKLSARQKLERKIRTRFKGENSFRFNEMSLTVDMGRIPCNMTTIASTLDCKYGIVGKTAMVREVIMMIAYENKYHPVKEFLLNNYDEKLVNVEAISNMSTRYFGTDKPIYDMYIKKMLIGAVRRVFEPGCYLKEMVVLHGSQDAGKSQWIRKLAGDEWFNDQLHVSGKNGLTRDDKEMIRRYWLHEIAEMDKLYSKADDAALKSMISSPSDNFRVPYAVDTESFPRMSIFIGTTNRDDILKDPTGESRFLVIPVEKGANEIDLKLIESERSMIWATAYHLYLQGEQHWLTPDEKIERKISNERFVETDEWFELIHNYLDKYETSNISVIMIDCLGLTDKKDFNTGNSKKIVDILNKLGWKPVGSKKVSGKVLKVWGSKEPKENPLTLTDSFSRVKHILYPSDVTI